MKKIPLTHGKFATVDDDDFVWLSAYNWQAVRINDNWHAVRYEHTKEGVRVVYMDKEIMRRALREQGHRAN